MGFFADTSDTIRRFSDRIDDFHNLYRKRDLKFGRPKDVWRFITLLTTDKTFRHDLVSLGNSMIRREGGKISLTILFSIIAVSIGGVGIAGMGSAFGLPAAALATILGSLGFGIGQGIDTAIAPSNEPAPTQTSEEAHREEVVTMPAESVPANAESSVAPHLSAVLQILHSLDEAFTPLSAAITNNSNQLKTVEELLNRNHLVTEGTNAISIQLRNEFFPKLERIPRTIETQGNLYRESVAEQTKVITPLSAAITNNSNQLKAIEELLNRNHLITEGTNAISVQLRDEFFPKVERISRAIEAQGNLYRENVTEQTKAMRRLNMIGIVALVVITLFFSVIVYIVAAGHHSMPH